MKDIPKALSVVRILRATLLLLGLVALGAAAALPLSGCGGEAEAIGAPSPTATPAPAWLVKEATQQAAQWGDPHPTAAYWGLLRDPELGRLTSSGPDDPSHALYVIVLVGHYSKAYANAHLIDSSSPLPPIKWILTGYTEAHADAGLFGFGTHNFDAAQYPSLQPLTIESAASGVQGVSMIVGGLASTPWPEPWTGIAVHEGSLGGPLIRQTRADGQGAFTVDLPPGAYTLIQISDGAVPATVAVPAGEYVAVELTIQAR